MSLILLPCIKFGLADCLKIKKRIIHEYALHSHATCSANSLKDNKLSYVSNIPLREMDIFFST